MMIKSPQNSLYVFCHSHGPLSYTEIEIKIYIHQSFDSDHFFYCFRKMSIDKRKLFLRGVFLSWKHKKCLLCPSLSYGIKKLKNRLRVFNWKIVSKKYTEKKFHWSCLSDKLKRNEQNHVNSITNRIN